MVYADFGWQSDVAYKVPINFYGLKS